MQIFSSFASHKYKVKCLDSVFLMKWKENAAQNYVQIIPDIALDFSPGTSLFLTFKCEAPVSFHFMSLSISMAAYNSLPRMIHGLLSGKLFGNKEDLPKRPSSLASFIRNSIRGAAIAFTIFRLTIFFRIDHSVPKNDAISSEYECTRLMKISVSLSLNFISIVTWPL